MNLHCNTAQCAQKRYIKSYDHQTLLLDPWLRPLFLRLSPDEQTLAFLDTCSQRNSIWNIVKAKLSKLVYGYTESLAVSDFGRMFVVSEKQLDLIRRFIGREKSEGWMLDIGAGSGTVTTTLKSMLRYPSQCIATEMSNGMVRLLSSKGIKAFHCGSMDDPNLQHFIKDKNVHIVSLMNILDRCSDPIALLSSVHCILEDDGFLIIALVFPYHPLCEYSSVKTSLSPDLLKLGNENGSWEAHCNAFCTLMLDKGFKPICISKVPYFSETDEYLEDFSFITDCIVICSKITSKQVL